MGSLIVLPLTAAIVAAGVYMSALMGFFLASLAVMVASMTALIALVLLI
jgi:hypothetical protein